LIFNLQSLFTAGLLCLPTLALLPVFSSTPTQVPPLPRGGHLHRGEGGWFSTRTPSGRVDTTNFFCRCIRDQVNQFGFSWVLFTLIYSPACWPLQEKNKCQFFLNFLPWLAIVFTRCDVVSTWSSKCYSSSSSYSSPSLFRVIF
jgi:hypothetical protein